MSPQAPHSYSISLDKLIYQLRHTERVNAADTHSLSDSPAINLLGINLANCGELIQGNTRLELATDFDIKTDYQYTYWVFVNKVKLGYVSIHHLRPAIGKELIRFAVLNPMLYSDFVPCMKEFMSDFRLEVNNITKIDLAIDTNKNLVNRFIKHFTTPTKYQYLLKKSTPENIGIPFAGELHQDKTQSVTLYPKIANDKTFRIYNKTRELKGSGKQYITDYHEANGLDINQDIYRVELSLSNTAFLEKKSTFERVDNATGEVKTLTRYHFEKLGEKERQGFKESADRGNNFTPEYTRLNDSNYLLEIVNKYTNGLRFFSVINSVEKNKSRWAPIHLLSLGTNINPLKSIPIPAEIKTYKKQMTTTFKTLVRLYYTTNEAAYLETARMAAKESKCEAELDKQLARLLVLRPVYQKPTTSPSAGLPL